jgi:transcriptional regulator with XRE-family HTH domain
MPPIAKDEPHLRSNKWKSRLGARLKELRLRAQGGRGFTQPEVAAAIRRQLTYINRLENQMETENPTLDLLNQLCVLYGCEMGDLFEPLVPNRDTKHRELKEKLDFILSSGVERTMIGIEENIHAMVERTKRLKGGST